MRPCRTLLAVTCACGSVGPRPPPDGSVDPPAGPVVVEVRSELADGNPDLAANVLISANDGTVAFDGLVDGVGKASGELSGEGSVTVRSVVDPTATTRTVRMTTIRGVRPGDRLSVGRLRISDTPAGARSDRMFSYTPFTGAAHVMYTPCGNRFIAAGGATTGTVALFDSCAASTFDFLAVAEAGSAMHFVYLPGQQRAATSPITVPLPWTQMNELVASYTNVPSGMEYLATVRHTLLNDVPATTTGGNVPNPAGGGSFMHRIPYPQGVGSGALFAVSFGNQTNGERQSVTIRTATPTATLGFDFATMNLPRLLQIPALTVDGASWTETAGEYQPDARLVVWRGSFADGARTTTVEWMVIDGERASSVVLPTLPPSHAAYDPRALSGFTPLGGVYVYYADCDVIDGYAAARPLNAALFRDTSGLKAALGESYRCRVTESPYNDP